MKQDVLQELAGLVSYDKSSGEFFWRPRPLSMFKLPNSGRSWNKRFAFKKAGRIDLFGYVVISFSGKKVKAHQLAYFIENGFCPDLIDHINGNRADNRIANIRPADMSQNGMNRSMDRRNKSGGKGVSWHKRAGKWQVHVRSRGVVRYCGLFNDIESAIEARAKAAHEMHGEFICDGGRNAT